MDESRQERAVRHLDEEFAARSVYHGAEAFVLLPERFGHLIPMGFPLGERAPRQLPDEELAVVIVTIKARRASREKA